MTKYMNITFPNYIDKLFDEITKHGFCAYAVGGCVRDMIMGIEPHDYDITTDALPEEIIGIFVDYTVLTYGLKHGTVTVIVDGHSVEITTFRWEGKYMDHRHPSDVVFSKHQEDDLSRRDFTINAIACDRHGNITDPFGGLSDIASKTIRCVGEAKNRFSEDALRVLRALRFSSKLGFDIEIETEKALRKKAGLLCFVSGERIREELKGILLGKDAGKILRKFPDVFSTIIPELSPCIGFEQHNPNHIYDVYTHITYVVENSPFDSTLRFAALLHDIGKPLTYTCDSKGVGHFKGHALKSAEMALDVMNRLKFDSRSRDLIYKLVVEHDTYSKPNEFAVKKRLSESGSEFYETLLKLQIADNESKAPDAYADRDEYTEKIYSILKDIKSGNKCFSLKELSVNGNDLLGIGITPELIGNTLNALLYAVIYNKIHNEKTALLDYAEWYIALKNKKYILFDLDGTLTDPAEGITKSVIHALEGFGIYGKTKKELLCFIGPPLDESFMKYFGMTHDEAVKAIQIYREHFAVKGLFENEVYNGIPELLSDLKKAGKKLILATSKPGVFADRILEHFDLMKYFDLTVGSELDGTRIKKGDVIAYALEKAGVSDLSEAVMIGDISHDILGGKENSLDTIGVVYGYGSLKELADCKADVICDSVSELRKVLLSEV